MRMNAPRCLFFSVFLLFAVGASAQQPGPPVAPTSAPPASPGIVLDVVVTAKSGVPESGLQQQDFTLLDNKVPQPLTQFQAVDGRLAPIEMLLVIDAVNASYENIAYERDQLDKFLRADNGRLAHQASLVILTDTGVQVQEAASSDGNAMSALLEKDLIALRTLRRSAGFYGAAERFELSVNALRDLIKRAAPQSGRTIMVWISPGWPLLSGPNVQLDGKEREHLFSEIVALSTALRQSRITLYSVDPLGTADIGTRTFYWQDFVKGVTTPNQVQVGNLALPVLATQSGGAALNSSNDITAQLQKCMADLGSYYQMAFQPSAGAQPREYHHLEVHIAKPGLSARTLQGYYSQP
jgi:VWFA-related protein